MSFSVEFHHTGSFVNDPTPHYEGGQVHVVHNLDMDNWSYIKALGIVKDEIGYFGDIKMWWKARESGFENGPKLITMDNALELAKYALTNKCEVEVYIEHDVSLPCYVEEERVLACNENNVGSGESKGETICGEVKNEDEVVEMSDSVVEDVHFDDSVEGEVVAIEHDSGNPSQVSTEGGEIVCGEVKNEDEVVEMSDSVVQDVHFHNSVEGEVVAIEHDLDNPSQVSTEGGEIVCGEVKNEDEVVEMRDSVVENDHFDDSVEGEVVAIEHDSGNASQVSTEDGEKCEKRKRKSVPAKRPIGLRRNLPMRKAKSRIGWVDGDCGKSGNNGEIQELKEEYNTEDLDSGESYSKPDDVATIVNYTRFKKEDMSKDFEFKLGMEFGTLQEFKEAIIEHSILNGREIKFQKNDAVRVSVKCKHSCNFEAFVRKVGSDTFRMKTLDPKHTCERVFNNKNAKSKWVAKVVADKFRSSDKMKIKDIISEVKSSYAIGITASMARKARQIAKGMCTTESQKPHPQGGQAPIDPIKASLKQKKATAKEQPGTGEKRGKRKAAATCTRKTKKSRGIIMSQQGPIDVGPIVHTTVSLIVEPQSMYQLDGSNGGGQGIVEGGKDNGESYLEGDDAATIINYTRFKKEDMSKDFEFKLGMEFGSLQEFKDAIIEHSILNGREIWFQKNDAIRVRARCKHSCNFVAFVSKVGSDNTFRMKTLDPEHTCERVFNNKNAKSKWVAKVVADKFRSGDKMKINDIITEVEASYAIGITPSRARRAKQIAKRMCNAELQKPGELTTGLVKASLKQKKTTTDTTKEPIMHSAVALIVEPLSTYKPDESNGGW